MAAALAARETTMTRDEQLEALRWHSTVAGLAKGAMVEIAHMINAGHTPAPDGKGWTTMQLPAGTVGSVVHADEDGMKVRVATPCGTETVWVWPADWSAVVPQ